MKNKDIGHQTGYTLTKEEVMSAVTQQSDFDYLKGNYGQIRIPIIKCSLVTGAYIGESVLSISGAMWLLMGFGSVSSWVLV